MNIQLPPTTHFRQFCSQENGWSDHYGAVQTAAAYAGTPWSSRYVLRGVWQHGCFGPWQNLSAKALSYSAPRAKDLPVWVARPDQAELLAVNGYAKVRVTGLPIVYTPETSVVRWPNSLLVVPTHTLNGDKFPDRSAFDRYAGEIAAVAARFSKVVICVHPNCIRNGLWVDEFSRRGFQIVYGAQTNDANALLRMRMLFEQFEHVTTNGWGSHVAYALAFGAKVSIHGSRPTRTEADHLTDLCWAANPEGLRAMMANETLEQERLFLQDFRQTPENGVMDVARGRWLIGADHRLSPEEMGRVLPQLAEPQLPVAQPPREQRQQIRRQAGELAAAGRAAEAVQLLLRFVRLAADTKDARFIHETLVEIAADLGPLDPAKGAYLREQADKLSHRLMAAGAAVS